MIETWIKVCSNDLDCSNLIVHEMRDFLRKLSVLGYEYKSWCHKIGALLHLEVSVNLSLFCIQIIVRAVCKRNPV